MVGCTLPDRSGRFFSVKVGVGGKTWLNVLILKVVLMFL
jgi:hypothetical protein